MNPDYFAEAQFRDWMIYKEIAREENVPQFKAILEKLIIQEQEDFEFWKKLAIKKEFHISRLELGLYRAMRKFLGLTFTARFLESHEKLMIDRYTAYMQTVGPELQKEIERIIEHERFHERSLIAQIKEDKVEFMSSIILGLNDGLIELTGALVGFSLALRSASLVALTGVITGLSASMSMAASAYMQAQYEPDKNPTKSAFYTGVAYVVVVVLLITPYLIFKELWSAMIVMGVLIALIIGGVSFYTSVIFERSFRRQLGQMFVLSVGVAAITFVLGLMLSRFIGVTI